MIFQSAMSASLAEKVFRAAQNAATATLTSTDATIAKGAPVILATDTDSDNGQFIARAITATAIINNLYIGNVHAFPDTTINGSGTWQAEDVGLVQCYGIDDDARILPTSDGAAVGSVLIPNNNQAVFAVTGPQTAPDGSTAPTTVPALGGLAITLTAPATGTDVTTTNVFLRCM